MLRDRKRAVPVVGGGGLRRRLPAALGLALAALLLAAPAALAQAPPDQQESPDRCDQVQNQAARLACRAASAPGNFVGDLAGDVVASAGDSALRSFTSAVAAAGKWFLEKVGAMITGTTDPNVVNSGWFSSQYRVMLALAVIVALPMLLISVAQSIVRSDIMQALRSAFVYLPIAGVFSAAAPALAQVLIGASDWMSSALAGSASGNAQQFMTDVGSWLGAIGLGTANPAVPVFGVLLGAIIVVLGAISIWIELLLRSAAIYIAVLFLPFGFAAMVWPRGWVWCKRLIEFLIAIIFAKVFIVAIINLAAAGLAGGGLANTFEGVLAGGALLLMAAFTPIALLKLIPIAEAAVVTAGHQRAALRQATSGATAFSSSSVVSQMIQSRFRAADAQKAGAAGWSAAAPTAAVAAATSAARAARNRATSSFAAMSPGGDAPAEGGAGAQGGDHRGARGSGAIPVRPPRKVPELAPEAGSGKAGNA